MKKFLSDKLMWLFSLLLSVDYKPLDKRSCYFGGYLSLTLLCLVSFLAYGGELNFVVFLLLAVITKISYSYKPHVKEDVRPSGPTPL